MRRTNRARRTGRLLGAVAVTAVISTGLVGTASATPRTAVSAHHTYRSDKPSRHNGNGLSAQGNGLTGSLGALHRGGNGLVTNGNGLHVRAEIYRQT